MSKEEQTKMDQIVTEMREHICDKLCKHPCRADIDQEHLDTICDGCKMGEYVSSIVNTYNELNDFEKSQCFVLLQKISQLERALDVQEIMEDMECENS